MSDDKRLDTLIAYAEQGGNKSRFFMDHGVIHDRLTSRHVAADFEDDWQPRLLALLNEQEEKIKQARTELIECHERSLSDRETVVVLAAKLNRYAAHDRDCIHHLLKENPTVDEQLARKFGMAIGTRCTCGLDAALSAVKP